MIYLFQLVIILISGVIFIALSKNDNPNVSLNTLSQPKMKSNWNILANLKKRLVSSSINWKNVGFDTFIVALFIAILPDSMRLFTILFSNIAQLLI